MVDSYIYLGVKFFYNGGFAQNINRQVSQAKRALNSLMCKAKILRLPADLVLELFDQTVLPVLIYGCEVWGFSNLELIETFYRKFLKRVLAIGYTTQNGFVYGETGRTDLKGVILSRMVGYWLSLVYGRQNKISALLYKFARYKHYLVGSDFSSKWLRAIEEGLERLGMQQVWADGGLGYDPVFIKQSVKLRGIALFDAEWQHSLQRHIHQPERDSFRIYRLIKPIRGLSPYIFELDFYLRRAVTRFFCRCNYMPCSDFRLFAPNNEFEGFCHICDREFGDELHYIFRCPFFERDRARFGLDVDHMPGTEEDKLVSMMSSNDADQLTSLARYFYRVLDICEHQALGR